MSVDRVLVLSPRVERGLAPVVVLPVGEELPASAALPRGALVVQLAGKGAVVRNDDSVQRLELGQPALEGGWKLSLADAGQAEATLVDQSDWTAPELKLVQLAGDDALVRLRLSGSEGQRVVVGRSRHDADLAVEDEQVSRRHFSITVREGVHVLEDLGSKARTFLNGKRVSKPVALHHADRIRIGESLLEYVSYREVLAEADPVSAPVSAAEPESAPAPAPAPEAELEPEPAPEPPAAPHTPRIDWQIALCLALVVLVLAGLAYFVTREL